MLRNLLVVILSSLVLTGVAQAEGRTAFHIMDSHAEVGSYLDGLIGQADLDPDLTIHLLMLRTGALYLKKGYTEEKLVQEAASKNFVFHVCETDLKTFKLETAQMWGRPRIVPRMRYSKDGQVERPVFATDLDSRLYPLCNGNN